MEIRFEGASFAYAGRPVLCDVTATIPEGRTVAVIGASGCGKSTLLKLVNGLLRPTAGAVRVGGSPLDTVAIEPLRRRIGYVMQEAALFPHLTVEDNVALLPRLEGWAPERIAARVGTLMRLVDLDASLLARSPRALSGGQRKRVALARALMLDPPVLLMDEPFSALDPIVRRELQDEFLRVKAERLRTTIFVTHDFSEAHRLADRIVLLDAGRIVQDATPAQFVASPATPLARAFVESARGIGA